MDHLGYLFGVMWMCLAVAALLGYLLSYFWRRASYQRRSADSEQSWLSRLRQTEQDRDARIARLTSEVEELRHQAPTMERSLAERSDIINSLEKTIDKYKFRNEALESEIADARTANHADDGGGSQDAQLITDLESELADRNEKVAQLHKELDTVRQKNEEVNARAQAVEEQLADHDLKLNEQQTLFDRHQDVAAQAQEQFKAAEQKVADLKQELSNVNGRYSRLQSDHGENAAQLDVVSKKLTETRDELDQHNIHANQTQEKLAAQAEQLASTKARLEQVTAERKDQEQTARQIEELAAEIQQVRDESAQHADGLARAELRKTELEQTLRSRNDKLANQERETSELRNQLAELEARIAQNEQKRTTMASELAGAQSQAQDARSEVAHWQERFGQIENKLTAYERTAEEARQSADYWQSEHDKLKAQLSNHAMLAEEAQQESRQLRHELAQAVNAAEAAKAKNAEWQKRLDGLEHAAAVQARDDKHRIAQLELSAAEAGKESRELDMLRRTLKARDAEFAEEHQRCKEQREMVNSWRTRYEALEIELKELAEAQKNATRRSGSKKPRPVFTAEDRPAWLLAEAPAEKDDLKKIWGVGPVMEKTMNDLGIYLFRQIAAFGKKDVEWVTAHINTFPDRIARDDWVGQAAVLRKEKYGR